jgi:hypothetical protein
MPTDVELAFNCIKAKRDRYNRLWDYYDGDHPLIYTASRLKEIFEKIDASFSENWCAVVVDSVLERIQLERFSVAGNDAAGQRLAELWLETELAQDSYDAHLCALVTGESAIIAGRDEDGAIEAYYNDSRLVHVEYEKARPRVKRFAAKLWQDTDAWRMTMYYPDRLEYWFARSKEMPENGKAFVLDDQAPNEFAPIIPAFHIVRERRAIQSELKNILNPQAQLNKLLADMMVAGEFGAFPQRYIISQSDSKTPLKNAPNLVWNIPASDGLGQATSVGELTSVQLANYIGAIDRAANVIAAISRTPKHYFFQTGDAPSGEALLTMESPLVKKCWRYIGRFGSTWRQVGAFLLLLDGQGQFQPNDIDAVWASPSTMLPYTTAQTVQVEVQAGVPLRTSLRRQGWSDSELAQLDEDKAAEQAATASLADALLGNAQRNFDQGNGQGGRE